MSQSGHYLSGFSRDIPSFGVLSRIFSHDIAPTGHYREFLCKFIEFLPWEFLCIVFYIQRGDVHKSLCGYRLTATKPYAILKSKAGIPDRSLLAISQRMLYYLASG
jgi:hypothetical protein